MKQSTFLSLILLVLTAFIPLFAEGTQETAETEVEKVELIMGSWRTDDVEQINTLLKMFNKSHPEITIKFQPTNPPDYNATLRLQLESGTGPDLMYARSYTTGQQLFKDGYFADLSDLEGLKTNYSDGSRAPWTNENGQSFAVPFIAVSHGIYYNKDIFYDLGISVPETWENFLNVCEVIKKAGIIPVANALGDEWDIAEVVLMSIAPNFLGGREGRLAYDTGERQYNDEHVVELFTAMQSLAPYMPQGFEALTYNDSNALFATGQAAMYFDGSWSLGTFNDVDFEWDVMAPPAPAANTENYICFHPDAGVGMNPATKYPEQVKTFLTWLGSKEGAQILANVLPSGMFPMSENSVTIENAHANSFLALKNDRETDVRWVWPKLLAGSPSGYDLVMNGSINVISGNITPRQAADDLKNGLAQWYAPAQD